MQDAGLSIGSNLGFSVLIKGTSTCAQEDPSIEPPTQRLVEYLLYQEQQEINTNVKANNLKKGKKKKLGQADGGMMCCG